MMTTEQTLRIETAVPLLADDGLCRHDDSEQHISSRLDENDRVKKTNNNNDDDATFLHQNEIAYWNMNIFIFGTLLGMFLSCLSLVSLEIMYSRYGNAGLFPSFASVASNNNNNNNDNNDIVTLEQLKYVALFCLSHVWDAFYPSACMVFLLIICSKDFAHGFAKVITGKQDTTTVPVESIYIMVVCLEGGFLLGSGFVGLGVELYVGAPLSVLPFVLTLVVDISVCFLLYVCCIHAATETSNNDDIENEQQQQQQEEEKDFSFVALV